MRCNPITSLLVVVAIFLLCSSFAAAQQPVDEDQALMDLYFGAEPVVESVTRVATPIGHIAENVTIISSDEIEAMHVHSVKEILRYVAGVQVSFNGLDLGGPGSISIYNSDFEHVLVLLDGVRWSFIDSDWNDTSAIPVAIIHRIEVIKGAASSAWGSSLGGVINIITKGVGITARPTGSLQATYGFKGATQTYDGQMAGKVGRFGYFFHGGSLDTDGLVRETHARARDHETYYGKLNVELPRRTNLSATMGRFDPYFVLSSRDIWGGIYQINEDDFFYSLRLDSQLADNLVGHLEFQGFKREYYQTWGNRDHSLRAVSGYLAWSSDRHKVVAGGEHNRNYYQDIGTPDKVHDEFWGVYANDTISMGRWIVTPGLRYDANLNTDDLLSPSLGVTFHLSAQTLFRGQVASGFRRAPSAIKSYSPTLESSKAWTYQGGVESRALGFATVKGTAFYTKERDTWVWDNVSAYVNSGSERHTGFELEAESVRWHNLSCLANYSYVYTRYQNGAADNDSMDLANLILRYDSPAWTARLAGHFQWNNLEHNNVSARNGCPIWDLTVTRHLTGLGGVNLDLFCTGHNLFDGSRYWSESFQNAGRWLEGGVKLLF